MGNEQSPPSAAELDALLKNYRQDPGRGFVSLGEAYLAMGRPADAIQVASKGLTVSPNSIDGRLMVAQSFFALHKWREAQGELLKVVKADKENTKGFRLLGEVLLRRGDFERAIPVLQHAVNLSPADPGGTELLQLARSGGQLGPPAPIPVPYASPKSGAPRLQSLPVGGESSHPRNTGVRPRLVSNEKPVEAAQESLRVSAAVGERHLRDLLAAGLVDVPSVRTPSMNYDIAPESRWRRSLFRVLAPFVLIVAVAVAGGFGWIWYTNKSAEHIVAGKIADGRTVVVNGSSKMLIEGKKAAESALALSESELFEANAIVARNTSLLGLLYGDFEPAVIAELNGKNRGTGFEEDWLIADLALSLYERKRKGDVVDLADAESKATDWLANHKNAVLVHWLLGEMYAAQGDTGNARKQYLESIGTESGSALGEISLGRLALLEGEYERADEYFDSALARSEKHPLALLGKVFSKLDRSKGLRAAVEILNVDLNDQEGREIAAHRALGFARANFLQEAFAKVPDFLLEAEGADDMQVRARVALLYVEIGLYSDATRVRASIGNGHDRAPMVRVLDSRLLWWRGFSRKCIAKLGKNRSTHGLLTQGLCSFDIYKFKEARKVLKRAYALAPDSLSIALWYEAANLVMAKGKSAGEKAERALSTLGLRAAIRSARLPHGLALLLTGDVGGARRKLQYTLDDVSKDTPNAEMHRSQVALGRALLREGKYKEARKLANDALSSVPGFADADVLLCEIDAREGKANAEGDCRRVAKSTGNPNAQLALAQLYGIRDGVGDSVRKELKNALAAGATKAMVKQAVSSFDSKSRKTLAKEFDL